MGIDTVRVWGLFGWAGVRLDGRALLLLTTALGALPAAAHKPSDAYLTIDFTRAPTLRIDVALRDLDDQLQLDVDGDGGITWGEVLRRTPAIEALIRANLSLSGCTYTLPNRSIVAHSDGSYLVLDGPVDCVERGPVALSYSLFFERDPQHRALVRLKSAGEDQTLIASHTQRLLTFALRPEATASVGRFLWEGVHHILIGADHLLFLTGLLLTSVLLRTGKSTRLGLTDWQPRPELKPTLLAVVRVVTAFTVAHSITLTLAAWDVVQLPSRWVESAIAATVMLAAAANLWPLLQGERWGPAFTLGLVHGFGFSSVLRDSGLRGSSLVSELLGFNLGVEVGQLVFVAAVVPACFLLRRSPVYVGAMRAGSAVIIAFGAWWLFQRALL